MMATQLYSEIKTTNDVLEGVIKLTSKQETDMDTMRKNFLDLLAITQLLTKQIDKTADSQIIKELDDRTVYPVIFLFILICSVLTEPTVSRCLEAKALIHIEFCL